MSGRSNYYLGSESSTRDDANHQVARLGLRREKKKKPEAGEEVEGGQCETTHPASTHTLLLPLTHNDAYTHTTIRKVSVVSSKCSLEGERTAMFSWSWKQIKQSLFFFSSHFPLPPFPHPPLLFLAFPR